MRYALFAFLQLNIKIGKPVTLLKCNHKEKHPGLRLNRLPVKTSGVAFINFGDC